MAQHIASVKDSAIPRVTKAQLYTELRGGDQLYCSGRENVSEGIEVVTASPWSHVLMCWLPPWSNEWLTLEATIQRGVHVGLLRDYLDSYDGDLVLARRPCLTQGDIFAELNAGFALLDDGYDWQQEVSIAARKLIAKLPLIEPHKELYCSGLQYAMSLVTRYPLQRPDANYPTPEDNWTDPTVEPVCALLYGTP